MLLTVESARTTRGQPGLSSFVARYTDGYGRQGQPDSLLGKSLLLSSMEIYRLIQSAEWAWQVGGYRLEFTF